MDKPPTSTVTLDLDTVARIEKRADEIGLTPAQFVSALVRNDEDGDYVEPSEIEDLEKRWA